MTTAHVVSSVAAPLDDTPPAPLGRAVMMGWGLGTLGPVIVLTSTNALLLRFMTDYVGLSAAVASLLIGLSKLYDAFFDPTMGWISDRTRSRWGRRRPYLVVGGAMLAVSMVVLFRVPPFEATSARVAYMAAMLVFYATAYTVFTIPYMAMPAEMTSASHQRTQLMSWRVAAVGLAQIVALFIGAALVDRFGGGAEGHFSMALAIAPVVLLSSLVCFWMTSDAPFTTRSTAHVAFAAQARSVVSNRPYVILIAVKLLTLTSLSAYAIFPFFFQRIMGVSNAYLGTYFAISSVVLIASQPLWIRISARFGKPATYRFALLASLPVWLSFLVVQAGDPLWTILLRAGLTGFCGGGALLMGQSLLPDTMEYDYLRTGLRREGIFAGFYTTVEKVAAAAGIAIVGAILASAGYVQSRGVDTVQPESALLAIRLVIALLPTTVSVIAIGLLFAYPLTEKTLAAMRARGPQSLGS